MPPFFFASVSAKTVPLATDTYFLSLPSAKNFQILPPIRPHNPKIFQKIFFFTAPTINKNFQTITYHKDKTAHFTICPNYGTSQCHRL